MGALLQPYPGKRYVLEFDGIERQLPVIETPDHDHCIAYFDSLGDTEFAERAGSILEAKTRRYNIELLATAPLKGITVTHEMACRFRVSYIVFRREKTVGMVNPMCVEYKSVTSGDTKRLWYDDLTAEIMQGKSVGIVDDISTTGGTLDAVQEAVEKCGGSVIFRAAALCEGERSDGLIYAGKLPIFELPD